MLVGLLMGNGKVGAAWWALGLPGTIQGGQQPRVCLLFRLQKQEDLRLQTEPRVLLKSGAHGAQPYWGKTLWEGQQPHHLCALSPGLAYSRVCRGHGELEKCCGCTGPAPPGEQ